MRALARVRIAWRAQAECVGAPLALAVAPPPYVSRQPPPFVSARRRSRERAREGHVVIAGLRGVPLPVRLYRLAPHDFEQPLAMKEGAPEVGQGAGLDQRLPLPPDYPARRVLRREERRSPLPQALQRFEARKYLCRRVRVISRFVSCHTKFPICQRSEGCSLVSRTPTGELWSAAARPST
jgi:hypothetical protein